jgi:hypothetical protein
MKVFTLRFGPATPGVDGGGQGRFRLRPERTMRAFLGQEHPYRRLIRPMSFRRLRSMSFRQMK